MPHPVGVLDAPKQTNSAQKGSTRGNTVECIHIWICVCICISVYMMCLCTLPHSCVLKPSAHLRLWRGSSFSCRRISFGSSLFNKPRHVGGYLEFLYLFTVLRMAQAPLTKYPYMYRNMRESSLQKREMQFAGGQDLLMSLANFLYPCTCKFATGLPGDTKPATAKVSKACAYAGCWIVDGRASDFLTLPPLIQMIFGSSVLK